MNERTRLTGGTGAVIGRATGFLVILALVSLVGAPAFAAPTDVTGQAPRAERGFPSVVILEAHDGVNVPLPDDPAVMDQVNKTFVPGVVAARLGQVVEFHNGEDLLHNVHALNLDSGDTAFNVALPVSGMVYPWTPDQAAVYAILCDAHPEMEAYVIVADAPYVTVAAEDGSFEIDGVAEGEYTMRIWNVEEKRASTQQVQVTGSKMEIKPGR